jgi:hypothetical protein
MSNSGISIAEAEALEQDGDEELTGECDGF